MPPHHSGGGTASFSNFSKADSGAGFLLSAAIFYLIAIASYYHFLGSDYFLLTKSAWTTDAGYTKLNFVYFVLGTYFLPAGILFTLIFISKSSKYLPSRSYGKLLIYVFLLATFIVGCITSANNCSDVLNCIGIFCIGTSRISSRSSGVISFNLALFFIAIFFSIIFASLSLIEGFILYRMRLQPEQYSSLNVVEKSPLADSDLKVITNFNSGMRKCVKAVRSAERAHRRKYMRAWLSEALLMTLVFLVLYPILILASTLLPTWWSGFTRYKIQQYQLSVPSQAYGLYWSLTFQNKLVLKLYPDIVIYYGAIYIVSFLALLAQYWLPLRLFFHKRLTSTVCVGQVLLGSGLVALLLGEWCYWFFGHSWENNLVKPRSNAELAARSFGQVGNVVLGLLVLPVAKSGVWSKLFGVSWEGMIVYHQLLGYAFLLIILFHMLSWWYVFALKGSFPSDIFSVPMTYHKDNFTVPLSVLTSLVMFIIMGGLTFNLIRRKCYELFYYFHLFSGVIFLSVLW